MAACAVEASRWDWSAEERQAAALASQLADRVYEGAGTDELAPLFEQLSGLYCEEGAPESLPKSPAAWLAGLGRGEPGLQDRARRAFHRLRYVLYEDGPPKAAQEARGVW